MFYTDIFPADTTNGSGIRVVLWVSGCSHHCKECHNPQTWCPTNGTLYTPSTTQSILSYLNKPYIEGITLSGGDPLYSDNLSEIYNLIKTIRKELPNKTIWIYSGYTWEEIHNSYSDEKIQNDMILRKQIVEMCDVFIDGKFEIEKKNIKLDYCGSENQKVINVQETLSQNKIIFYQRKEI